MADGWRQPFSEEESGEPAWIYESMAGVTNGRIALIAVALGFFLMAPLGMIFNRMEWPLFHTWGLAHGSFIFAWPLLTLFSFVSIKGVMSYYR